MKNDLTDKLDLPQELNVVAQAHLIEAQLEFQKAPTTSINLDRITNIVNEKSYFFCQHNKFSGLNLRKVEFVQNRCHCLCNQFYLHRMVYFFLVHLWVYKPCEKCFRFCDTILGVYLFNIHRTSKSRVINESSIREQV